MGCLCMDRRAFVSALALAATGALAGCASDVREPGQGSAVKAPSVDVLQEVELPAEVSGEKPFASLKRLESLSAIQKNSLNMMNYMVVLMYQVNASKNNRLLLGQIYDELFNNSAPDAVDGETRDQITSLTDAIEDLRLSNIKRERLRMVYERSQAAAAKQAIPDPIALLSAASSGNLGAFAMSVIYMAVDAQASYASATDAVEMEFVEGGWKLDDKEEEVLHRNRTSLFVYIVNMVEEHGLPGYLAMTEKKASQFADWEDKDIARRIRFFEKESDTYCALGAYWLMLARSYFEDKDYAACIEAIEAYESSFTGIFIRDMNYAKALALGISALEMLEDSRFASYAERWVPEILKNCDSSDWALRYFAAQAYLSLARETGDGRFISLAYETALDNINELIDVQHELNDAYIAPVAKEEGAEDLPWSSEEQKEKHRYNKLLEDERRIALAPLHQPLLTNLEFIHAILAVHPEIAGDTAASDLLGASPFLVDPLNRRYGSVTEGAPDISGIEYDCLEVRIPVSFLTLSSKVSSTVKHESGTTIIKDWKVDRVERGDETDPSTYVAVMASEDAKDAGYSDGSTVTLEIDVLPDAEIEPISVKFTAVSTKDKPWEQLAVWDDGYRFERK